MVPSALSGSFDSAPVGVELTSPSWRSAQEDKVEVGYSDKAILQKVTNSA